MKITFFSDTHTYHDTIVLPESDVLVHTGDFTNVGSLEDVRNFAEFMNKQPHYHKVVIAGNHDFCFEDTNKMVEAERILKDHGIIYLNDSGVTLFGNKFWGSPVQPKFGNWAFNRERGVDIRKHWDLIPNDTDILLTHGPPHGILDKCDHGERVGCRDLLNAVDRIRPRIHAFGHIHEGYGMLRAGKVTFVNSCILDHRYTITNEPIVIEVI